MIRGNENVIRWFIRLVRRDMEACQGNETGETEYLPDRKTQAEGHGETWEILTESNVHLII